MAKLFDDRGVDESRDGFDGRVQEGDRMQRCVAAREQRRAHETLAARLRPRMARIVPLPQVCIAVRLRQDLRDDQRQREREVDELFSSLFQQPALG